MARHSTAAPLPSETAVFPELRRLGKRGRKTVPHVQQMEWTDCGAACLASVLGYYGREVTLPEVRENMPVGRDGVSAKDILEGGARFGLRGRGVSLEVDELSLLPRGAILHWEFNHFVVLDRVDSKFIHLIDPALGLREVTREQFSKAFTGVALVFEPEEGFTEAKKAKQSRYHVLWSELWDQRTAMTRVVVISLLLRLFALAAPLLTAVVVDKVVPRGDFNLLTVVLVGVASMVVFESLSSLARAHLLLQVRATMDTRMTLGFLDQLVSLPYSFFQSRSTGDLLMRVRSNATIREIVTSNTMSALLDGFFVLLYIGAIVFASRILAVLVLVFSAVNGLIFFSARGKHRRLMVRDLEIQARSQDGLVQLIEGIQTLKCAGVENQAVQKWSKHYVDEINVSLERGTLSAWVDAIGNMFKAVAPLALLGTGATLVIQGQLTLGSMLAVSALAGGVFGPVESLMTSALQLQLLSGYMERVEDVMRSEREQNKNEVARSPALQGRVSARNVCFRYNASAPLVVDGFSLEVPPGSSVAVVGASGSGKSTVANLLVGLYQPQSGVIAFDSHPLSRLDLQSVRRQIGIVPQHPFIFGGSIRENIALTASGSTLEEVVRAATVACIHDDIMSMPMAYDTIVSGGGTSLSGGQRQRMALARAVIRHAPIIMLDEATSALDAVTEERVMQNLRRLGCTRIIIAHRLSTISDADIIVVMHGGKLIESGSHQELVARRGPYWQLIQLQSGGPTPRGRLS